MRHRIELRAFYADDTRAIVWDDEAGAVSGDHEVVPDLAAALAEPEAVIVAPWGAVRVRRHARNAVEFLGCSISSSAAAPAAASYAPPAAGVPS